jgi:hypothetical protein
LIHKDFDQRKIAMSHSSQTAVPQIDSTGTSLFYAPNQTGTPERRLLMAILERAILDFVGNNEREVQEAEDWLFDNQSSTNYTFSFEWLCEQLDLDSGSIAQQIKDMPKRGDRRVAPWYFSQEKHSTKKAA